MLVSETVLGHQHALNIME